MIDAHALRVRTLAALGILAPAPAACRGSQSSTAANVVAATSTSSSASAAPSTSVQPSIVDDDPEGHAASSAAAPNPNGCGTTVTQCTTPTEAGGGTFAAPFNDCAADYYPADGNYDRVRFSPQETRAARARGDVGTCCYRVSRSCYGGPMPVVGRPLRIGDDAITARVVGALAGDAWSAAEIDARAVGAEGMDPRLRAQIAAAWARDAAFEHASIGAFSLLSLQLLSLGAPPSLLAATHAAASDEVIHARLSFAIAGAFAGEALAPMGLEVTALRASIDLTTLARETLRDGCLGEGAATLRARAASKGAKDATIAATLERIADDEERHAELAWRIVAWAVRTGGASIAAALRDELDALRRGGDAAVSDEPFDGSDYGVLPSDVARAIDRTTLVELVRPCLDALLADAARVPASEGAAIA